MGYRRVRIGCTGPVPDPKVAEIRVQIHPTTYEWLRTVVFGRLGQLSGPGNSPLRIGVTLRGNYLRSLDGKRYLRGSVGGWRNGQGNYEPRLFDDAAPRREGDLEIWVHAANRTPQTVYGYRPGYGYGYYDLLMGIGVERL
jgi:hypothetical protein